MEASTGIPSPFLQTNPTCECLRVRNDVDEKKQHLIKYPINRNIINSPTLLRMKKNAAGGEENRVGSGA